MADEILEQWRPLSGFRGAYEVSDLGQVRSLPRKRVRQLRILSPYICPRTGYVMLCLRLDGRNRVLLLHRVVLETFGGPCPEGEEGRHKDGVRTNNAVSNLCWGTPKQNAEDRDRHGNTARGTRASTAKLSEEKVLEIRQSYVHGPAHNQGNIQHLCTKYGVGKTAIQRIVNRRTW